MYTRKILACIAVKNLPAIQEPQQTQILSLGQEDPQKESIASHFNILACRIPKARGEWCAYGPWGGKMLDMTEQLNNRNTFLTETLKILEIHEKLLRLNKAKQKAWSVELNYKIVDTRAELEKILGNKMSPNSSVNSVFHTRERSNF